MKIQFQTAVETAELNAGREFRIPAITITAQKTVLCSCERRSSHSDWSIQSLGVRRSEDGGRTWSVVQIIAEEEGATFHNPTWIVDGSRIHLLYGKDYERVFHVYSDDDGCTFSKAREITDVFAPMQKVFEHNVIATGPGHGLRLGSGRLMTPVWLANGAVNGRIREHRPSIVTVLYSDDHGESWQCATTVAIGADGLTGHSLINPSETEAVELADGCVLMNIRNENPCRRRALAVSRDGGLSFNEPVFAEDLFDPVCYGGVDTADGKTLYYVGCRSEKHRKDLTVMYSSDGGKNWKEGCYISKPAGYADICVSEDAIYVFYEVGSPDGIEKLMLAVVEK